MQRAKNPVLKSLDKANAYDNTNAASYVGISIKSGILLLTTLISAGFAWFLLMGEDMSTAAAIFSVTGIVALVSVLLASFFPRVAMPFSILYTLAQGFSLGVLTYIVEAFVDGGQGIALTALVITLVIFGVMLALYSSRTIRATNKFRKMMYIGIITILITSVLSFFIPQIGLFVQSNPVLAILVSLFLIIYGAFMLILNFDQAEIVVENGLSKNFEWSVALGLMISLIWIYVEVIRFLLIILQNKD